MPRRPPRDDRATAPRRVPARPLLMAAGVLSIGLLALVLVRGRSPRSGAPPAARPVLLVTIDTLRADRVGAYGYKAARTPALDALAAGGVLFENALAPAPLTLPSHATILSGLLPPHHGVRENGVHAFPADLATLATTLRARGYATGAFVGAYVLDRRFGLARGFDVYDDRVPRRTPGASVLESERPCGEVVEAAEAWLFARDGAWLAWAHFYEPHAPYAAPPAAPGGDRYDGDVAEADRCLGRLLAAARAGGRDPLVVVTGDHGEGLGDHEERTHGLFLYETTLRVPLVVAGPGVPRGERRRGLARLVDVAATVLGRVAPDLVPRGDGTDLLAGLPPRETYAESLYPRAFAWAPLRALRVGDLKLVEGARPELFDLAGDPGETRDLAATRPADVERLRGALAALRATERAPRGAGLDREATERLRALGYVAGPAAVRPDGGTAPDPRDMKAVWRAFEDALESEARGEAHRAIAGLRAVVAAAPGNAAFQRNLAAALRRQGRTGEAIGALQAVVKAAPEDGHAWHELAVALADAGRSGAALDAARRAVAVDPGNAEAFAHLGILEARRGRPMEALAAFDAAVAVDPTNARAWNSRGNALHALGKPDEAAAAFRRGAELAPADADPRNGLAVLAIEAGQLERAAQLLDEALRLEPGYEEAALNRAVVDLRLGRRAEAAARLDALRERARDPVVREKAAALRAGLGG